MTTHIEIPVVDIALYGLRVDDADEVERNCIQTLGDQICRAFSDVGFCYIRNHGIPQSKIDQMKRASRTFFEMPLDVKRKVKRPENGDDYGWFGPGVESTNLDRPGDYKEAFDYLPTASQDLSDIPLFQSTLKDFFQICHKLSLRLFDLVSIGLKLEDDKFLRKCHALIGQKGNIGILRTVFYPPIPENEGLVPNQVRCGEHSDYGSLTLLFQDDIGGLEVRTLAGEYIPASPIPGTILINIGDLMQRWTADKLIATKHRVLIPEEELKRKKSRQSVVFFIRPDNDVMIDCLDGSEKYSSISSQDYVQDKLYKSY